MIKTIAQGYRLVSEAGARGRFAIVVALAALVSVFEAASALLVVAVMRMVAEPDSGLDIPVVGDIRRFFPGTSIERLYVFVTLGIAGFFVLRAVLGIAQAYIQQRVAANVGVRLSGRLVRGYLHMPYARHLDVNSNELTRNAYESVRTIVLYVFVPAIMLVSEALVLLALLLVLVFVVPVPTVAALAVVVPLVVILLRIVQPRLARLGEQLQTDSGLLLQALQQGFQGVRDIKILGKEDYFQGEFEQYQRSLARVQYLRETLLEIPRLFMETVFILMLVLFLAVAGPATTQEESVLPVLGLFGYAAFRMMPALNRMMTRVNLLRFGAAATATISSELERLHAYPEGRPESDSRLRLGDAIKIENLTFRYETADRPAVENVDFVIQAGESVGLVGATGSGKSTLVDLVLGLLTPDDGRVLVDGVDVRNDIPAWYRSIGVVPQSPFLLDDTLRRNIAVGLEGDTIDDDALQEALELAQLADFVATLPQGVDSMLGEGAVRLSGGQRQRVAIARALYRRPEVLFFDEATSALDNVTEAEFVRALDRLRGVRTLLIVAHRLTTVRRCDRIVLMEGGRVVDIGAFDDLVDRNATFRQMVG